MAATSSDYRIEILCPSQSSELRLERGIARERLGTLFEINLSLYSTDKEIDLGEMLGAPMAVHVKTADEERFFHGIVSHFSLVGISDDFGHYQVVLRPKLWLLGESACSRVFTGKKVADLLKDTFQRGGVDFGGVTSTPAVKFEYCVQYRESDLHFVSRLMEHWGLYYFHKHEQSKHTLEVVDSLSGHADVGTFAHAFDGAASDATQITNWRIASALRSSNYRVEGTENLTRTAINAESKTRFNIANASKLAVHDFEAVDEYPQPWLDELATARMRAIDATVEEYSGTCRSTKIAVGSLFTLAGHPRKEQNRQYLIVAAAYQFDGDMPGSPPSQDPYVVAFTAIDSQTPFCPPVTSKKPVVQGPHLATVVKEADDMGRVGVKFHWGNPDDDTASCMARVSQNWAGKQWGGVFMPHIDHEVIVEFLDGDPDQPLITGRVYNQENMPPLALPGDKEKSIIRDHGGNEIMMDGAAKQIRIYCPSHESEIWLGKSIELRSTSDLKNFFTGNWDAEIGGNHTSQIKGKESRTIMQDVEEKIIGKLNVKVGADFLEFFAGAAHKTTIGLTSQFIGGVKKETIMGAEIKKIGGVKFEQLNGLKISKGKNENADDFKGWFKKVKTIYKTIAKEEITEIGKAIKATCEHYSIGAKMLVQELEDLKVKASKEIVHQGKTLKMMADTAWEVETKKARAEIAKWAVIAKLTVNEGNFEVKK